MDLDELEAVAQAIGAGGPRRILRIPDEIDGGGIAGAIIFDAQLLTFIAEVAGVGAEDSRRISVNPPEGNGILRQDNDLVSGDVRSIGEAVLLEDACLIGGSETLDLPTRDIHL